MSIEEEISELQADIDQARVDLGMRQRSLDLLQAALKTEFLDTLKFAVEEGLLPDLMMRLGYGQESADKAGELVDVVRNPRIEVGVLDKAER